MMNHLLTFAFLLLAAAPSEAQVPEAQGPYPVGWKDVSFSHPLSANSTVQARLYYPAQAAGQNTLADPTSGPFPLVGFLHGYFAFADYYDDVCTQLASHGFFVASVATESGFFMSVPNEAKDARAMLHWTESQAQPGGSFPGMVEIGGDWSTIGHSNGGAASFYLSSAEPRVKRLVLFEPNWLNPPGVNTFDGAVMVVGSSEDFIAPAALNAARYFNQLTSSPRAFYVTIQGSGHNGSLDFPIESTTLPHAVANSLHQRLATGFLRAEVKGETQHFPHMLGTLAQGQSLLPISRASNPVHWSTSSSSTFNFGIAGRGDDSIAALAVGPLGASVPTAFGLLQVNMAAAWSHIVPMPSNGIVDLSLPYTPALVGLSVFSQGLRLATNGTGVLTAPETHTLL
ncbi:MAG: dienelactone hydrolase [Planctomycetota bacterium]|jgi:dienelactone hydrolase